MKLRLHQTRLLVAAVVLVLACDPAGAAEAKVIKATIDTTQIPAALVEDFGTVVEGQDVVLEIAVNNAGTTPLRIGAVKPLCSCMTEQSDRLIKAGSSGTITLRLETVGYSGETTEAALIEWIDRPVGLTRAEMKMVVQPILEVSPHKLVRFRAIQGKAATDEIVVRRADGKPLVVDKVETSAPYLSATTTAADNNGVRVSVTLGPDAPNGILMGTISIHTDATEMPVLEVKVAGLVAAQKAIKGQNAAAE